MQERKHAGKAKQKWAKQKRQCREASMDAYAMQAFKKENTISVLSNQWSKILLTCTASLSTRNNHGFGPTRLTIYSTGMPPCTPFNSLPRPGKDRAKHNSLQVQIVLHISSNYRHCPTEAHEGRAPPHTTSILITPTCIFTPLHIFYTQH